MRVKCSQRWSRAACWRSSPGGGTARPYRSTSAPVGDRPHSRARESSNSKIVRRVLSLDDGRTGVPVTATASEPRSGDDVLATLQAIERRVLWLAVRIVDYANRERPKGDALKVGGHQASSASMVTLMTALYLADLGAEDRVSVKPHASPVLHALEYLLGRLDRSYLTRLRDFGGLQSYPSRTKDPFPVDYSTGSVGLGSEI